MKLLFNILILFSFTALLYSCIEPNYFIRDELPINYAGFMGFRWGTPMYLIDTLVTDQYSAKPNSKLNNYYISAFNGLTFLDRESILCLFYFDEKGFSSIKIIYRSNYNNSSNDIEYYLDKISSIYGSPQNSASIKDNNIPPDYIKGFSWNNCKVELLLMPDYTIEINAYRNHSCLPPVEFRDYKPFPIIVPYDTN